MKVNTKKEWEKKENTFYIKYKYNYNKTKHYFYIKLYI